MTAEADLAFISARFSDGDPAGPRIPRSLNRVFSGALTFEPVKRLFGSVRVRHFGPRPLIEDNSVRSESTTVWNGQLGIRFNRLVTVSFEVCNLLNSPVSDIDYFYTSRLQGEPLEGEDRCAHPSLHPANPPRRPANEVLSRAGAAAALSRNQEIQAHASDCWGPAGSGGINDISLVSDAPAGGRIAGLIGLS